MLRVDAPHRTDTRIILLSCMRDNEFDETSIRVDRSWADARRFQCDRRYTAVDSTVGQPCSALAHAKPAIAPAAPSSRDMPGLKLPAFNRRQS